jgi:hypothetical protein
MCQSEVYEGTGNGVFQEVIPVGCVWEEYGINLIQDRIVAPV